jgi:hypothetical protein
MPDMTFLLALLASLLSAVSIGLHLVAPRTKTLIDDKLRDDLDQVLELIRGPGARSRTNPVPPELPTPRSGVPRRSDSGSVRVTVLLVLAGIGPVPLLHACSHAQRAANGLAAFLDCESGNIDAALLSEATKLSKSAITKWIAGDGTVDSAGLRSEAAPLKSDLMRCGFAGAIAALAAPQPRQPGAPQSAELEVDGPQLRTAFAGARAELGWAPVRLAGGRVL